MFRLAIAVMLLLTLSLISVAHAQTIITEDVIINSTIDGWIVAQRNAMGRSPVVTIVSGVNTTGNFTAVDGSTINIMGGTVHSILGDNSMGTIYGTSTVNIHGGVVTGMGVYMSRATITGGTVFQSSASVGGTVLITGGNIGGPEGTGLYLESTGKLVLTGGNFLPSDLINDGDYSRVNTYGGVLEIYGQNLISTGWQLDKTAWIWGKLQNGENVKIVVREFGFGLADIILHSSTPSSVSGTVTLQGTQNAATTYFHYFSTNIRLCFHAQYNARRFRWLHN